jgi:hypothetical protein
MKPSIIWCRKSEADWTTDVQPPVIRLAPESPHAVSCSPHACRKDTLVQRAVSERKAPISRATVVNFKAPREYFEEIEDLLKPREMRRFNAGFADFAVNAQRGG